MFSISSGHDLIVNIFGFFIRFNWSDSYIFETHLILLAIAISQWIFIISQIWNKSLQSAPICIAITPFYLHAPWSISYLVYTIANPSAQIALSIIYFIIVFCGVTICLLSSRSFPGFCDSIGAEWTSKRPAIHTSQLALVIIFAEIIHEFSSANKILLTFLFIIEVVIMSYDIFYYWYSTAIISISVHVFKMIMSIFTVIAAIGGIIVLYTSISPFYIISSFCFVIILIPFILSLYRRRLEKLDSIMLSAWDSLNIDILKQLKRESVYLSTFSRLFHQLRSTRLLFVGIDLFPDSVSIIVAAIRFSIFLDDPVQNLFSLLRERTNNSFVTKLMICFYDHNRSEQEINENEYNQTLSLFWREVTHGRSNRLKAIGQTLVRQKPSDIFKADAYYLYPGVIKESYIPKRHPRDKSSLIVQFTPTVVYFLILIITTIYVCTSSSYDHKIYFDNLHILNIFTSSFVAQTYAQSSDKFILGKYVVGKNWVFPSGLSDPLSDIEYLSGEFDKLLSSTAIFNSSTTAFFDYYKTPIEMDVNSYLSTYMQMFRKLQIGDECTASIDQGLVTIVDGLLEKVKAPYEYHTPTWVKVLIPLLIVLGFTIVLVLSLAIYKHTQNVFKLFMLLPKPRVSEVFHTFDEPLKITKKGDNFANVRQLFERTKHLHVLLPTDFTVLMFQLLHCFIILAFAACFFVPINIALVDRNARAHEKLAQRIDYLTVPMFFNVLFRDMIIIYGRSDTFDEATRLKLENITLDLIMNRNLLDIIKETPPESVTKTNTLLFTRQELMFHVYGRTEMYYHSHINQSLSTLLNHYVAVLSKSIPAIVDEWEKVIDDEQKWFSNQILLIFFVAIILLFLFVSISNLLQPYTFQDVDICTNELMRIMPPDLRQMLYNVSEVQSPPSIDVLGAISKPMIFINNGKVVQTLNTEESFERFNQPPDSIKQVGQKYYKVKYSKTKMDQADQVCILEDVSSLFEVQQKAAASFQDLNNLLRRTLPSVYSHTAFKPVRLNNVIVAGFIIPDTDQISRLTDVIRPIFGQADYTFLGRSFHQFRVVYGLYKEGVTLSQMGIDLHMMASYIVEKITWTDVYCAMQLFGPCEFNVEGSPSLVYDLLGINSSEVFTLAAASPPNKVNATTDVIHLLLGEQNNWRFSNEVQLPGGNQLLFCDR